MDYNMGRPESYHLNNGCHNCKFLQRNSADYLEYPLCFFNETRKIMKLEDMELMDDDDWEKRWKDRNIIISECAVAPYGHCEEWKLFVKKENQ